jgi:hypothetical protein
MLKKHVFLCCEHAGTDLSQKDEKSNKYRKNGHESERRSKSQSWDSKVNFSPSLFQDWQN